MKSIFGHDFEAENWTRFWSWSLVEILNLNLVKISKPNFGQDFEGDVFREAEFRSKFWSWSLVKILKLKFGRDSETEFWCFLNAVTLVEEVYRRVRCAFDLHNFIEFYQNTRRSWTTSSETLPCLTPINIFKLYWTCGGWALWSSGLWQLLTGSIEDMTCNMMPQIVMMTIMKQNRKEALQMIF